MANTRRLEVLRPRIDLDATLVVADAGCFEAEVGGRRLASQCEQQMAALDDVLLAADADVDAHAAETALDALDLRPLVHADAFS